MHLVLFSKLICSSFSLSPHDSCGLLPSVLPIIVIMLVQCTSNLTLTHTHTHSQLMIDDF